jgi:hypothetical protein
LNGLHIQKKEAEAAANEEDVKILERIKRMNEEGPFELPSPIEAELKKLEQERTEFPCLKGFAEGESDSAVSTIKNDEVPATPEPDPRAINPILSNEVDRSEIASIHPATQAGYPFLSFLELRDGWTLMEVRVR